MVVPVVPDAGVKDVITGAEGDMYVNPAKLAEPPALLTNTSPLAPLATTAVMVLALTKLNDVTSTAPMLTELIPEKSLPLIVIVWPVVPEVGVKLLITGAGGIKLKPAKLLVPPGVVTETDPEEPFPTTAEMVLSFSMVNEVAGVPPKLTPIAPLKLAPEIITVEPAEAAEGAKLIIFGSGK
jgi:hypothetical protein